MLDRVIVLLALASAGAPGFQRAAPSCPMQPPFATIQMPASGLAWLPGEPFNGACDDVPADRWIRKPSHGIDVLVDTDGPEGSGRYWTIAVGLARTGAAQPHRGICFMTSTAGWPILQSFREGPLPWLEDLDTDGKPEAIVWLSFYLTGQERQWESGLMAWAYQIDPSGSLALDRTLSQRMAREIAGAYRRSPVAGVPPGAYDYRKERRTAADALAAFAAGRCVIAKEAR